MEFFQLCTNNSTLLFLDKPVGNGEWSVHGSMAPPSLLCLQVRSAYPQLQVHRPKIPYAKRSRPRIPLNDSEWAPIH